MGEMNDGQHRVIVECKVCSCGMDYGKDKYLKMMGPQGVCVAIVLCCSFYLTCRAMASGLSSKETAPVSIALAYKGSLATISGLLPLMRKGRVLHPHR